jgi:hypothetical protein
VPCSWLIASAPTIVIVGGVVSDAGGFTGAELLLPPPPQAISIKDRIPILPNFESLAKPLNGYINCPKIAVKIFITSCPRLYRISR